MTVKKTDKWNDPAVDEMVSYLRELKKATTYDKLAKMFNLKHPSLVRWILGTAKPSILSVAYFQKQREEHDTDEGRPVSGEPVE